MSDDSKIYVDASRPAILNDGAGKLTDCFTLQEAVLAWRDLPAAQKIRATVKVIGEARDQARPSIQHFFHSGRNRWKRLKERSTE